MKQKIVILVFFMCFACGLIAFAAVCNHPCFRGSRTADAHTYRLEIERMTGTDTHTLELEAGDTLQIQFETVKGTLHLTIKRRMERSCMKAMGKAPLTLPSPFLRAALMT